MDGAAGVFIPVGGGQCGCKNRQPGDQVLPEPSGRNQKQQLGFFGGSDILLSGGSYTSPSSSLYSGSVEF